MTLPTKFYHVDSNYMTQNYSNSSTSIREVITISILYGFDQKKHFFEGALGSSLKICDWHSVWPWYFTPGWQKGYRKKLVQVIEKNWYGGGGWGFTPSPHPEEGWRFIYLFLCLNIFIYLFSSFVYGNYWFN